MPAFGKDQRNLGPLGQQQEDTPDKD